MTVYEAYQTLKQLANQGYGEVSLLIETDSSVLSIATIEVVADDDYVTIFSSLL